MLILGWAVEQVVDRVAGTRLKRGTGWHGLDRRRNDRTRETDPYAAAVRPVWTAISSNCAVAPGGQRPRLDPGHRH